MRKIQEIPGFRDYMVSNDGVIMFKQTLSPVPTRYDKDGYLRVTIRDNDGINRTRFVHRLVAITFIPNPDNKPQVNHKDGNKDNCSDWNLEWCTNKENSLHAINTGLNKGYKNINISKPILQINNGNIVAEYDSIGNAGKSTGCNPSNICKVLKGRMKTCGGFEWRYK